MTKKNLFAEITHLFSKLNPTDEQFDTYMDLIDLYATQCHYNGFEEGIKGAAFHLQYAWERRMAENPSLRMLGEEILKLKSKL